MRRLLPKFDLHRVCVRYPDGDTSGVSFSVSWLGLYLEVTFGRGFD